MVHSVQVSSIYGSEGHFDAFSHWSPIFDVYIFSDVGMICSEGLARRGT